MTKVHWSGTFDIAPWTRARHATVLIQSEGELLAAGIIGDDGTVIRYALPPSSLGNFIAAITQQWASHRPTGTLVTMVDLVSQSTGGPHPGGGGPGGDGEITAASGSVGGPHPGGGGPGGKEPYFAIQPQTILVANLLRTVAEIVKL